MAKVDNTFRELCAKILDEGVEYENKNRGVTRLQIPSYTFRHDFNDGFPAITLKDLYWKGIVGELIWFLRGDNDVKYLNDNGIKIWNKDAYNWYKRQCSMTDRTPKTFEEFSKFGVGSVGQNYSKQWRNFNGKTDQILDLITGMNKDIMSSRLKVNAWNPSEIFETALPPCHSEFQVIGVPLEGGLFGFELHWNQRSVDTFLGLPFNIASYGLLAQILEHLTGYKALAIEGTLKCVHFYDNQYKAVKELMARDEYAFGNSSLELQFSAEAYSSQVVDEVFKLMEIEHFKLADYESHGPLKVEMLAPKEI